MINYKENGKAKNHNIVRQLKKENNLEYFFNYVLSPNSSLIKNYLKSPK